MKTEIPVPLRIRRLPWSEQWQLHVPWFVAKVNGEYDFRIAEGDAWAKAITQKRCWICGDKLGVYQAFIIGPMCCINRVSADPPMHRDCALYSVRVCPFLTQPKYVRRQKNRPPEELMKEIAGLYISRNPGVSLMWVARADGYKLIDAHPGYLFRLFADPVEHLWFARGRLATRAEVEESIASGFPTLYDTAREEGDKAIKALLQARMISEKFLPDASPDQQVDRSAHGCPQGVHHDGHRETVRDQSAPTVS